MSLLPRPNLSREAIREFLIETQESLQQIESDLVELEGNSIAGAGSPSGVGHIFRRLHSIKGTCGFLGYPKLEELAHLAENLLGRLRDGILTLDATTISALLSVVDAMREVLDYIERDNREGDQDYSNLTQHLSQILSSGECSEPTASRDLSTPSHHGLADASAERRADGDAGLGDGAHDQEPADGRLPGKQNQRDPSRVNAATVQQSDSIAGHLNDSSVASSSSIGRSSSGPTAGKGPGANNSEEKTQDDSSPSKVTDSTLRIDISLLDKMMMLAGELVLTRNRILQEAWLERDDRLHGVFRQLSSITSELQGCVMQSRMRPIATIWKQMPRMVRDVALAGFKQVRLEMEGSDTELDKTIVEAIKDPLTHVLRNAVDHGIELPELRAALGKPPEGRIWMRAYHVGGQINIEIGDDGAGIDAQAIRRKALERNLARPEQVSEMGDLALLNLIFQPGFSTAQRVTRLSGRGIGLDVVKSNIEKLGGTIHVQSTFGKGTTFTLRIPLTLAIVQALIVKTAGECYVVPQSRIVELVHLSRSEAMAAVGNLSGEVPDYRFRGRLLPVVQLSDLLELDTSPSESVAQKVSLMVLKVHNGYFGLIVDRVIDSQEVVIKPLWQPLRSIPIYAGATQLADGVVALILDPVGLAKRAGLVADQSGATSPSEVTSPRESTAASRILLARLDHGERVALPTDGLNRIARVASSGIKRLRGQEMIDYAGEIIRVIDLATLMRDHSSSARSLDAGSVPPKLEMTHVALYSSDSETVGLIVGATVDIVRNSLDVRGKATRRHVQFTTMIDEQLFEFLDVDGIIRSTEPLLADP